MNDGLTKLTYRIPSAFQGCHENATVFRRQPSSVEGRNQEVILEEARRKIGRKRRSSWVQDVRQAEEVIGMINYCEAINTLLL